MSLGCKKTSDISGSIIQKGNIYNLVEKKNTIHNFGSSISMIYSIILCNHFIQSNSFFSNSWEYFRAETEHETQIEHDLYMVIKSRFKN